MMKNLPEEIYFEIISNLDYSDRIVFAMTNTRIAKITLKRVRMFRTSLRCLTLKQGVRELVDNLIVDPYYQFHLSACDVSQLPVVDNLICETLNTDAYALTMLISRLKKVQSLELVTCWKEPPHYSEFVLPAEEINNSSLSLKKLSIAGYNFIDLPVIKNLESLSISCSYTPMRGFNIADYSNLRVLKFDKCPNIEDVSSLGRIYELHLIDCHGIRDISCLNDNYKIIIEECSGIVDYSRSFRCSKIVKIVLSSNPSAAEKCNLSHLLEVREFSIRGVPRGFVPPQCASLRHFSLEDCRLIPKIQEMSAIDYLRLSSVINLLRFTLSSVTNLGRIYYVKLHSLAINTLEGLGRGNRVVEIENCPRVTDFRVLRYCSKVSIRDCEGFQDFSQLRGVKRFIFSSENLNSSMDMKGVTCLKVQDSSSDFFPLKLPKSLKRLVFEFGSISLINTLPMFFSTLPSHVRKILVFATVSGLETFRSMLSMRKEEGSFQDFTIQIINKQIHFVRKLH